MFREKKKFKIANKNDKFYINLSPLKNKSNYPNTVNYISTLTLLKSRIMLFTLAETKEQKNEYVKKIKSLIIELQHKFRNQFFPNIYCIETLTDDEIKIIIDRLFLSL